MALGCDEVLLKINKIKRIKANYRNLQLERAKECCLLLAKASNERQLGSIGNQTGGRVGFFLFTDDFWRDYNKMTEREIRFVQPPTEFQYATVAVFEDLYGNMWDLIEPNENNKGLIKNKKSR